MTAKAGKFSDLKEGTKNIVFAKQNTILDNIISKDKKLGRLGSVGKLPQISTVIYGFHKN